MESSRRRATRRAIAVAAALSALAAAAAVADAAARTITRSQAPAAAAAISLRLSDLAGFTGQLNPVTAQERQQGDQLAACDGGVPESGALALGQSSDFSPKTDPSSLTVSSSTEILASAALVAKDLAAVESQHGLACLGNELKAALSSSLPKGTTVSLQGTRLPSVASGADGSFALRFAATLGVKQGSKTVKVTVNSDAIGFTYGQAEVELNVIATGGAEPSASLERRLAALLVARAKSAAG
jgi:hypothetical protein